MKGNSRNHTLRVLAGEKLKDVNSTLIYISAHRKIKRIETSLHNANWKKHAKTLRRMHT
jgi:hypothetical protein